MDPKTKQLVEEAEALVEYKTSGLGIEEFDKRFVIRARSMIPELSAAVREQDKRARHAEQERDAFDKRIVELEAQLHERTVAAAARDALTLNRLRIINEYEIRLRELETQLDYAKRLARFTIQQRALITDEMKALAVSVIG